MLRALILRFPPAFLALGLLVISARAAETKPAEAAKPAMLKDEELCAEVIRQLQEANPKGTVEKADDLEVDVTDEKGTKRTYPLTNCRRLVAADPANAPEIIANFIKAYDEGPKQVPEAIVPVVKDVAWVEEMLAVKREHGAKDPNFASEPINDQLVVVYALDSVRGQGYLSREQLRQILPDTSGVRPLALENLERLLPKFDKRGSNGFFMIGAGGVYDSSLLLLDRVWTRENFGVKGDFVVGIPTRDIVVITGSNEKEGLKRVREYVDAALARDPPYRLSADLFVRRDGQWMKWTDENGTGGR
jgi:hypothetical protein